MARNKTDVLAVDVLRECEPHCESYKRALLGGWQMRRDVPGNPVCRGMSFRALRNPGESDNDVLHRAWQPLGLELHAGLRVFSPR